MHLSVDESFGNVFVEALATDLPIVAYDTPRTRWIIGDEGFLVGNRTAEDLAETIVSALRAGSNGTVIERARNFGWPSVATRYNQFFREVLA